MENKLNRDYLIYKTGDNGKDKKYDFQSFKTIDLLEENFITMIYH